MPGSELLNLDFSIYQRTFFSTLLHLFSCQKKVCKESHVHWKNFLRHDHWKKPPSAAGCLNKVVKTCSILLHRFVYPVKELKFVLQYSLIPAHCRARDNLLTGFLLPHLIVPAMFCICWQSQLQTF